jgi:hypothetical protein
LFMTGIHAVLVLIWHWLKSFCADSKGQCPQEK